MDQGPPTKRICRESSSSQTDAPPTTTSSRSFLSHVADSVRDILKPSWLLSLVPGRSTEEAGAAVPSPEMDSEPPSRALLSYEQRLFGGQQGREPVAAALPLPAGQYGVPNEESVVPIIPVAQAVNCADATISAAPNGREMRRDAFKTAPPPADDSDRATPTPDLNESTNSRKRSFDVSSFAKSYNESMSGSILSPSRGNSSYYPGKTVFGGRSSVRTFSMPKATPYHRITKPVSAKKKDPKPAATSTAAKIILKSLEKTGTEQMKSIASGSTASRLFTPALYLRKKPTKTAPPLDTLPKHSQAKIVPNMHKRDVEQLPSTSSYESQSAIEVTRQFVAPGPARQSDAASCGGKLKSESTRTHFKSYSKSAKDDDVPFVSTSYSLQLNNAKPLSLNLTAPSEGPFQFSPPKEIDANSAAVLPASPTLPSFSFLKPSQPESAPKASAQTAASDAPSGWGDLVNSSANKWSCDGCLIQNEPTVDECVACRTRNPNSKPIKLLTTPSTTPNAPVSSGWGNLFKNNGNKWSCEACLIQNEATAEKCIACSTDKPSVKTDIPAEVSVPPSTSGWGDLMKNAANKWNCDTCLSQNDAAADKCAACKSVKPGSKQNVPMASSTSGWGDLMKNAANKWSCDTCLSQNDAAAATCAACKSAKPGSKQNVPTASSTSGWGDLMKNAANKWSCDTCLSQNDAAADTCAACKSAKPGSKQNASTVPSTSGWGDLMKNAANKWSCGTCLSQNDAAADKCAACKSVKPGSKQNASTVPGTSGWGDLMKNAANKWSCDTCLCQNDAAADTCAACKSVRSGSKQNVSTVPSTSGWGDLMKNAANKWSCGTCLCQNDAAADTCAACKSVRSGSKQNVSTVPSTSGWGDLMKNAANKWSCGTCLSQNDAAADKCAACGALNPKKESASSGATPSNWGNLFQQSQSKWSCSSCLVQNDTDKSSCVACGTANPSAQPKGSAPVSPNNSSQNFAKDTQSMPASSKTGKEAVSKPPPGHFKCKTCDFCSPLSSKRCENCGRHSGYGLPTAIPLPKPDLTGTVTAGWAKTWTCHVCYVRNPGTLSMCKSCRAYKAGFQSSLGDLSKGSQPFIYYDYMKTNSEEPADSDVPVVEKAAAKTSEKPAAAGLFFNFSKPTSDDTPSDPRMDPRLSKHAPSSDIFFKALTANRNTKGDYVAVHTLIGETSNTPSSTPAVAPVFDFGTLSGGISTVKGGISFKPASLAPQSTPPAPQAAAPILQPTAPAAQPTVPTALPAASLFSFTSTKPVTNAVQPENESSQGATAPDNTAEKPKFTFGVGQPSNGTQPAPAFHFGANSSTADADNDRPQFSFKPAPTTKPAETNNSKPTFSFGQLNKSANNTDGVAASNSLFGNPMGAFKVGTLKRGFGCMQTEPDSSVANKMPAFQFSASSEMPIFRPAAPSYSATSHMSHSTTSLQDVLDTASYQSSASYQSTASASASKTDSLATCASSSTSISGYSVFGSDSSTSQASTTSTMSSNGPQRTIKRAARRLKKTERP